jgi:hypothetical protein
MNFSLFAFDLLTLKNHCMPSTILMLIKSLLPSRTAGDCKPRLNSKVLYEANSKLRARGK